MKKLFPILVFFLILLSYRAANAKSRPNHYLTLPADTVIYDQHKWTASSGVLPPRFPDNNPHPELKIMDQIGPFKNPVIDTKFDVAMVFEKDGHISSFTPSKSAHPQVAKEVIRVMKTLPLAKPATKKGKPVRFRMYYTFAYKKGPNK